MTEMHAIHIDGTQTAVVSCAGGDFHEDAHDAAGVARVLSDAAMHAAAMGPGHEVAEHVSRDMTVWAVP